MSAIIKLPFVHRPPSTKEIERLRLVLSTYQDGTGMERGVGQVRTLPGWRDFERACAIVFNGVAAENKYFLDIVLPLSSDPPVFYGLDCKMRRELRRVETRREIYVEVTNAAKLLWGHLNSIGINESNMAETPQLAGDALLDAIEHLKHNSARAYPQGPIDISQSYYFVLLWDQIGEYQLFQLPIALPRPDDLVWAYHVNRRRNGAETTRLVGTLHSQTLYEWFGQSGGQFKYYSVTDSAIWHSAKFRLEPLPEDTEEGIIAKARNYFPELWSKTQ